VDRPAQIAEVALELAENRWHGERRKRRSSLRIEAIDGLDQTKARYLEQVLEGLSRTGVAPRKFAG